MNRIFQFAVGISLLVFLLTNPEGAVQGMVAAGNSAVALSLNLLAVYAIWLGILNIVEATGIQKGIERLLRPLVGWMFGRDLPQQARELICMNMTANLLGLGGAATPSAIRAIEVLDDKSSQATTPMIMLLVINAGGFSLIPTTIIGMRASFGSAAAADIIPICLIALMLSTIFGVLCVKLAHGIGARAKLRRAIKEGVRQG